MLTRAQEEKVTDRNTVSKYIDDYKFYLANLIVDSYIETRRFEDPKYKYHMDRSAHEMLVYIPHKEVKEKVKLFIKLYNLEYRNTMQDMYWTVHERMSTWQQLKFFCSSWVGSNYCPNQMPEM